VPQVEPYRPGEFYLRELPPLRAVLDGLGEMTLLVVDGFADLDPDGRPGLGARVHAEFAVPVIGVAKTAFRTATHAIPVLRGTSARPLYVTAAGLPLADAADLVRRMAGPHRMPTALRRADTLARHGLPGAP
jgi:deoxyribonuclease V